MDEIPLVLNIIFFISNTKFSKHS